MVEWLVGPSPVLMIKAVPVHMAGPGVSSSAGHFFCSGKMGNKSSTAAGAAAAETSEVYLSEDLQGE